jgi:hypothetical protein
MEDNERGKLSKMFRQTAISIVASGLVAATAVHAKSFNEFVLVPPTDLPALARQSGDAMLLHETSDGRTLLYIEQNQGAQLAIFDVTDPVHIKGEGSAQLAVLGPFDFVSPLGKQAELIRFRQGHEEAVLDLHKGLTTTHRGDAGFPGSGPAPRSQSAGVDQVVDTANTLDLGRVFDLKQVREEVTNAGTGTTFLLTDNGLYLIRRPAVEREKKRRDQEWFLLHSGG